MTRRQRNNKFTPPQKIPSAKNRWKISRLDFLGSRRHPPNWISSKDPNYQRGVLLISADATEGHFEGKTPATGRPPSGSCSCMTMPRLTGHLQPRRKWPTWASNVLITHPILQIWPCRTTICSLDWKKKIEISPFLVRRGGHCCRGDLVGRTNFWIFFLSTLRVLEQRSKKWIELHEEYVE